MRLDGVDTAIDRARQLDARSLITIARSVLAPPVTTIPIDRRRRGATFTVTRYPALMPMVR